MNHYTVALKHGDAWTVLHVWAADERAAKLTAQIHMIGVALGR